MDLNIIQYNNYACHLYIIEINNNWNTDMIDSVKCIYRIGHRVGKLLFLSW